MFNNIKKFWKEHSFESLLITCVIFILLLALYNKITGKLGTWNTRIYSTNFTPSKRKGPPKDSKGEIECRRVLQSVFNKPFNKIRPDFLRNPVTGNDNNLELDCYDPDLKLAVEYNGEQHYKYIPFFHSSKDAFNNQKYRDELKRRMCKDNGVNLIEVPYTIKNEDIESYLIKEFRKYGYLK